MTKAIIIDDEYLARNIIREYLKAYPNIEIVMECENGFDALKAIKEHQPQLIFLDIQMPKITGFEMLELCENKPEVVFTTAFEEYAIKAFEANAVDYLLKPFSQERFNKAVDKFVDGYTNHQKIKELMEESSPATQTERVVVKIGNQIKIIPFFDILFIEASDDYVNIYTQTEFFLKNKTMAFFEKSLDQRDFVRVHRSYIVRVSEIQKIEPYEKDGHIVLLKTGHKIPVSRTGYPKLRAALGW
ncbi:two component transcriptional regulator, LytTR family [Pseudopedobacter saltans DSM 12145]|uniref:Two component transcriptional regulator, LytTR family n=1 Tax=Pseudopedobacter saltans (strain ATCC 51119 / DSM 12145 / JCM 21818 / CCUG 39354 / LMG 10337 / NBRC 100064 / NCIMB 13643) TaxID=762903 RepID=F0S8Y7_PSESL|nr:LytTR family transcriptional regulator DNA-binding domain-containing protein [Pseudopedobacter saltans]ADY53474.1 two component transcriptional regulator, LytTR family [Pseudopedobacter saltans DSM 12145]